MGCLGKDKSSCNEMKVIVDLAFGQEDAKEGVRRSRQSSDAACCCGALGSKYCQL